MKLRAWATLLMVFITLTTFVLQSANAQYVGAQVGAQFGMGAYMGMQPCPWNYGAASGASSDKDRIDELKADRKAMRLELRQAEKIVDEYLREQEKLEDKIGGYIYGAWARVAFKHMQLGMNCSVCSPAPVVATAPYPGPAAPPAPVADVPPRAVQPPEITISQPRPAPPAAPATPQVVEPQPAPAQPAPPPIKPPAVPRNGMPQVPAGVQPLPSLSSNSFDSDRYPISRPGDRRPAQEAVSGGASPRAAGAAGPADFGPAVDEFGPAAAAFSYTSSDTNPTLCYSETEPYQNPKHAAKWQAICKGKGEISDLLCRHPVFRPPGSKPKPSDINDCSRALSRYRDMQKMIDRAREEVVSLQASIDGLSREIGDLEFEMRMAKLEARAGSDSGRRSKEPRGPRGPTTGQTLAALATDAVAIAGNLYGLRKANQLRAETGHEALPGIVVAPGLFPYATAGLYGGMYGGVNGAFGCSPTIGGGPMMGPYGYAGPYGAAGSIYGQVGGPFGYPQGYGYPNYGGGMYLPGGGPWGMNGPWGVGQWPGAGGYPGYPNWVGNIAAGIYAAGAMPAGVYPAGVYPAGVYAAAGMPIPAGVYPAGIYAAGAIPAGAFPAGAFPAGMYPAGGYPAGAFPAGMYPAGGYPAGAFPAGMYPAGVYPAGAYPAGAYPAGAYPAGMYPQVDPSIIRAQLDAAEAEKRRREAFMTEYSQFMSKWSTYLGGSVGGFGGAVGTFGVGGVGAWGGVGTWGYSGGFPSTSGGSGPTTTVVPGRTR